MLASALAGLLWDRYGPAFTFGAGAAFALLTLAMLALLPKAGGAAT